MRGYIVATAQPWVVLGRYKNGVFIAHNSYGLCQLRCLTEKSFDRGIGYQDIKDSNGDAACEG